MASRINQLSARKINSLTKPGYYADGNNLYLQVSKSGAKNWIFRFMLNGRRRDMGLGPISLVPLSEARAEAINCRIMVRDGIDPIEKRRKARQENILATTGVKTFKECALAYLAMREVEFKSDVHRRQWYRTLEDYAYPKIGKLPVGAIDTPAVMRVLEPIWKDKTETAKRVRGRIEKIISWATVGGYRTGENPARWQGHLDQLLQDPGKIARVKNFSALPYRQVGGFVAELRALDEHSALGLEFLILTISRTNEVIDAVWDEIDTAEALWRIPAARMKREREYVVPLVPRALEILGKMQELRHSGYIFPGRFPDTPMSNNTFLQLRRRMGYGKQFTVHGFRSAFKDWATEKTYHQREVIEMSMSHVIKDKTEAAYLRATVIEKRRDLLNDWAAYCSEVLDEPVKGGADG